MLLFGVMGVVLFAIITFTIIRMKKTRNFRKTMLESTGLSILLFTLACLWWLFQNNGDEFTQLLGLRYYGLSRVMYMLLFGVMGVVLFAIITFTIIRMKKTRNFEKTMLESTGLSILLFALACLWWLFQEDGDGLAQLIGLRYYGIAFVISGLLNTVILFFMKNKLSC